MQNSPTHFFIDTKRLSYRRNGAGAADLRQREHCKIGQIHRQKYHRHRRHTHQNREQHRTEQNVELHFSKKGSVQ